MNHLTKSGHSLTGIGNVKAVARFLSCILLSACLSVSSFAEILKEQTCRKTAESFLRSGAAGVPSSATVSMSFSTLSLMKSSLDAPPFYAYDISDGGFVVVAADDAVSPILAYSDAGSFSLTDASDNFRAWFLMWDKIISDCRSGRLSADSRTKSRSDGLSGNLSALQPVLLETASWGQESPYWNDCPKVGSVHCPTGCTATAVCILMRYFSWPESGAGTLPSYSYTRDGVKVTVDSLALSGKYDWSLMPLSYGSSATDAQKQQVSTLFRHVALMLQSEFALDATSASPTMIYPSLTGYMQYDRDAALLKASYYKSSKWMELLEENVAQTGPVVYAGYSYDVGHAFVIDGFDSEGRLHINWGYDGSQNGYYAFPSFEEYVYDHYAVIGLKPEQGGTYRDNLALHQSGSGAAGGLMAVSGGQQVKEFVKGSTFSVTVSSLANLNTLGKFDGETGVAITGSDYTVRQILSYGKISLESLETKALSYDVTLSEEIKPGDRIVLVYRSEATPSWTVVPYDRDDSLMVGEILIADSESIGESTSVSYVPGSSILLISTKSGVSLSLLSSSGSDQGAAVSQDGTLFRIDASILAEDEYVIVLQKNGESKILRVRLGLL